MKTAKHTPGPWNCVDPHVIRGPKNVVIAKTLDSKEGYEIKQANAHLIAAAPAMYEALKAALDYYRGVFTGNTVTDEMMSSKLEQALAQAEGT